jgi:RNA polymerase sigma-70 factor, ECF subfamily
MAWPGKKRSIEELVEAHYRCLFAFAFRLSGSVQEAEDLTQDAFCQAQAKLGQLRDWERAKSWLFTILRNGYLHRLRASKTAHEVPMDEVGELPDRLAEPLPDIDPEKLQQALNELPEGWRTPLILFYFDDFSYRDIADQMNVPLGTIMSRLARAKVFLRGRLLQESPLVLAEPRPLGGGLFPQKEGK